MKSIDDMIKNYSRSYRVHGGFEDSVFAKIEKRKRLIRAKVSGAVGLVLVVAIFSVILFPPGSDTRQGERNYLANRLDKKSDQIKVKEEIPVLEDVFFRLTDGEKNYAIEQVSILEEEGI